MSKFVKLTSAYVSGALYINPLRIEYFHARRDGGTYVCISADGDRAHEVTETPEQIMALIDGPADRDALVDALVLGLMECVGQIEYLHDKFQETGSGNQAIARTNALIDRAEHSK